MSLKVVVWGGAVVAPKSVEFERRDEAGMARQQQRAGWESRPLPAPAPCPPAGSLQQRVLATSQCSTTAQKTGIGRRAGSLSHSLSHQADGWAA